MKIYFDGGAMPNPGKMNYCVVINGKVYSELKSDNGTNNLAEWIALLWACELAVEHKLKDVEIIGDSKLVIMQASGQWKIKHETFIPFKKRFDELKSNFTSLKLTHVLRDYNLAGIELEKREKLL